MNHFIVTIGREFGSSGKEIGRELAWHLGVECYDRNIVEKAVEDSGLSLEVVSKAEERFAAGSSRLLSIGGLSLNNVMQMDAAVEAQSNVIKELADKSSCVIIGRCADFILKDRKDVLNVFIYVFLQFIRQCFNTVIFNTNKYAVRTNIHQIIFS